ncbi:ATP-dependent DNA ligase, partial [Leptospira borgpetersenii serovar Tarassovi]|nr:ATP-dependent DNA ligase [Leptospira borgpetersenii serovar Tarassovi]
DKESRKEIDKTIIPKIEKQSKSDSQKIEERPKDKVEPSSQKTVKQDLETIPSESSKELNKISLYYQGDGSDKVYHVNIDPEGDGYVVLFAFGRRGSTLQTGTKTSKPVSYESAQKI